MPTELLLVMGAARPWVLAFVRVGAKVAASARHLHSALAVAALELDHARLEPHK